MPSRLITDLHPDVQRMARCAIVGWRQAGLDVLITCTFRSPQEQAEDYAKGRTTPGAPCRCGGKTNPVGSCARHPRGHVVTNARPGQSSHNFRMDSRPASLALDVVPRRNGSALVWGTKGNGIDDDPSDDHTDDLELWQRVAVVAKACGLRWFGDPDSPFPEFAHFEHPNAKAIREGRAS